MNFQSLVSDNDDSILFRSSIIPKRKATDFLCSKTLKQSKLCWLQGFDKLVDDESLLIQHDYEEKTTLNETRSIYFQKNEKFMINCPICDICIESGAENHIKECVQKQKMTTKQMLSILENQKKQLKMKESILHSIETDPRGKSKNSNSNALIQNSLPTSNFLHELQDNILQKSTSLALNKLTTVSPKKKKKKKNKSFTLLCRTSDERQRLITEKAAVILLNENDTESDSLIYQKFPLRSSQLIAINSKLCRLWSLSENENQFGWYVDQLKTLVLPDKIEEESNININQSNSQEFDSFRTELSKLNLPKETFYEDWRKLINSENFSDLTVTCSDGRLVHLHSLILYARCSKVLEKDWKSAFSKFTSTVILIFLEYVYCGTLNYLKQNYLQDLIYLSSNLGYDDLSTILKRLDTNLNAGIAGKTPFSMSSTNKELNTVTNSDCREQEFFSVAKGKDLSSENDVDHIEILTPNCHHHHNKSLTLNNEPTESNLEQSYWSITHCQKQKLQENSTGMCLLNEKNFTSTQIVNEDDNEKTHTFSELEDGIMKTDVCNGSGSTRSTERDRQKSNNFDSKKLEQTTDLKSKIIENCIVISSDSESQEFKSQEEESGIIQLKPDTLHSDFDVPYFDPYENYINLSYCNFSPVEYHSQSLIGEEASKYDAFHLEETIKIDEKLKLIMETTPVSIQQNIGINSSNKKFRTKNKKSSNLSASRILRKSLHLPLKSPKPSSSLQISAKKRQKIRNNENWLSQLNVSIGNDFTNSPTLKSSTPVQVSSAIDRDYLEMTPKNTRDIEIDEVVTPYPNYSCMEEGLLKEHLAKYGLKKSLGKRKAQKILKHIYEELHPYINKRSGKFVKRIFTETPKNNSKGKSKSAQNKGKKIVKNTRAERNSKKTIQTFGNHEEDNSNRSPKSNSSSLNGSMAEDLNKSDYDDLSDTFTQSVPSCPTDIPMAMKKFLEMNPEFHEKILTYEPIWVRDLQLKLKEAFKKHYKIEDLVNYLDQKCITFRTNQQKFQKTKKRSKFQK